MKLSFFARCLLVSALAWRVGLAPAAAQGTAPGPAPAASPPVQQLHPRIVTPAMTFHATIANVSAELVTLDVKGAAVHIPAAQLNINVNGAPGAMDSLEVGDSVRMLLPPLAGSVERIWAGVLTVRTDRGPVVELPVSALPREVVGRQWVWVTNPQGKIIRMKLDEALDLGATILGPATPGAALEATGTK